MAQEAYTTNNNVHSLKAAPKIRLCARHSVNKYSWPVLSPPDFYPSTAGVIRLVKPLVKKPEIRHFGYVSLNVKEDTWVVRRSGVDGGRRNELVPYRR